MGAAERPLLGLRADRTVRQAPSGVNPESLP